MSDIISSKKISEITETLVKVENRTVLNDSDEAILYDLNQVMIEMKQLKVNKKISKTNQENVEWKTEDWLYEQITRQAAEAMLADKLDGTFLVRKSSFYVYNGPYALSIAFNRTVYHCLIKRFEQGYGFAQHPQFETLQTLVMFYRHVKSLKVHNPILNTHLINPLGKCTSYVNSDFKI